MWNIREKTRWNHRSLVFLLAIERLLLYYNKRKFLFARMVLKEERQMLFIIV